MKLLVALSIGTAVIASPVVAKPAKTSAATSEDARFTAFGERIVDANLKLDPVGATQAGDHRYDALMPDASAAGRAARDALAKTFCACAPANAGGCTSVRYGSTRRPLSQH